MTNQDTVNKKQAVAKRPVRSWHCYIPQNFSSFKSEQNRTYSFGSQQLLARLPDFKISLLGKILRSQPTPKILDLF